MEYTKFMNSIRRLPLNYPLLLIKIDNFLRAIGAEQKHNGSVQRELQKYINFEMKLKIYESTNIQKSSKQKMDGQLYTNSSTDLKRPKTALSASERHPAEL